MFMNNTMLNSSKSYEMLTDIYGFNCTVTSIVCFRTNGVTGTIQAGDSVCELNPNSSMRTLKAYRKKSCYILQNDRLNPLFTVAELMKFAADMKLGDTLTDKLKLGVVS